MDHQLLPFMDVDMKWIYKTLLRGSYFKMTAGNGVFQPIHGANISSIIYLSFHY